MTGQIVAALIGAVAVIIAAFISRSRKSNRQQPVRFDRKPAEREGRGLVVLVVLGFLIILFGPAFFRGNETAVLLCFALGIFLIMLGVVL
ncbi:MAG TPA: hypothetical protein ENI23_06020 [bacterium]|nr:hypothetical protein [bacterium]